MTTNPTDAQMKLARECAAMIGPFKLKYVKSENYSGEHREWNECLTVPQGCADITEAAISAIVKAIQATEARAQGLVDALENLLDDGHSFESEGQARDAARQALTTWRQT